MSLVIVEGPDGGGKTTLTRTLVDHMVRGGRKPHLRNHGSYPGESNVFRRYATDLLDALVHDVDVIVDRCWISEPIYGAAVRGGKNRVGRRERETLEQLATLAGAVVVMVLPPLEVCREAWLARLPDEYVKKDEQYRAVYAGYAAADAARPWPMLTVRYDRTNLDDVLWTVDHAYNPVREMAFHA